MSAEGRVIPALRFDALTPLFDPVVRVTTRERRFRAALLDQAEIGPGSPTLDLGCGTGTLAIELCTRVPGAEVVGLDADPAILARAARKARDAGIELDLVEGVSYELPFEDGSFDQVLSTLFFHHLHPSAKEATVHEIVRVLRPGGRLHVADWGRPADPLMRGAFFWVQLLDGFEPTRDNVYGRLPEIFRAGGFRSAVETRRLRTPLGTLALYEAVRP